ncbi:MAG: hypothetical protein LBF12_01045 [Christensenellaceae bacterium]|jgi:threonine dehydrogenase-like Zn-dependent dehydrogenase|nr:hypothetical protein [Christensenellaceae bacterium]
MKIYKAKGNSDFEIYDSETFDPQLVKLKIDLIHPTDSDINVYKGRMNTKYPIVPCRMATAIVSEDRPEHDLKRGMKVILNPYDLSFVDKDGLNFIPVYGSDRDGFLRDFVAMPNENIIAFPPNVKETDAVFTDTLAVAIATLKTFDINKGDYVAIIGGSILSNLIAQLVKYYQGVPIYISNNLRHLSIAEKCGIYYTVNETLEDVYQHVMDITGGRMAEHTVLHAQEDVSPHFLFSLACRSGDGIIVNVNSPSIMLSTNIGLISKKQLTIKGVSCGVNEITTAVNLLAQANLDLTHFIDKIVDLDHVKELFDEMLVQKQRYIAPIIKVQ